MESLKDKIKFHTTRQLDYNNKIQATLSYGAEVEISDRVFNTDEIKFAKERLAENIIRGMFGEFIGELYGIRDDIQKMYYSNTHQLGYNYHEVDKRITALLYKVMGK